MEQGDGPRVRPWCRWRPLRGPPRGPTGSRALFQIYSYPQGRMGTPRAAPGDAGRRLTSSGRRASVASGLTPPAAADEKDGRRQPSTSGRTHMARCTRSRAWGRPRRHDSWPRTDVGEAVEPTSARWWPCPASAVRARAVRAASALAALGETSRRADPARPSHSRPRRRRARANLKAKTSRPRPGGKSGGQGARPRPRRRRRARAPARARAPIAQRAPRPVAVEVPSQQKPEKSGRAKEVQKR
jgi:hypothetical protein